MAQVEEQLTSKNKVLSSNTSSAKKKKKKRERERERERDTLNIKIVWGGGYWKYFHKEIIKSPNL
jgi:hypothetical protein